MTQAVWKILVALLFSGGLNNLVWAADRDVLLELRKAKLAAAEEWLEIVSVNYADIRPDERLRANYEASLAVKSAAYELATTHEERLAALQKHADRMQSWFLITNAKHEIGASGGDHQLFYMVKVWLYEAKIWVRAEQDRQLPK